MPSRLLSAALCLLLCGQTFAAEVPLVSLEAGGAPVSPGSLKEVPGTAFNPALAEPLQLTLPLPLPAALPEMPTLSASARTAGARSPSALAAAQGANAALTAKTARENVSTAREAGVAAFDAQKGPNQSDVVDASGLSADSSRNESGDDSGRLQPGNGPVRGRWWKQWVPHAITGLNLASGVGSMVFASQGLVLPAAAMIALAAFFDGFDGLAARKLRVAGPMGTMMDSQADMVSFGAAPALLVFMSALAPLAHGSLALYASGFAAAAFSAFGAAYRLSRYNLDALAAGADKKPAPFFKGLPSPGGAVAIVALTFALPSLPAALAFPAAALGSIAVGALMMSRLPYYKVTSSWKAVVGFGLAALKTGAVAVLTGHAGLAPAAIVAGYLVTGPLVALYRGGSGVWKKELKRKAFHQANLLFLGGFLGLKHLANDKVALASLAVLTAVFGVVEYARLAGKKIPGTDWLEKLKRDKENKQPSGIFFGTLGATIAAGIAVMMGDWRYMAGAVLALAWGDAASPLFGMRFGFGRYRVNGTLRSADGTLAGAAVALGIGLALGFPLAASLGAAVVFSLVDTYPVKPDDNLWIPASYPAALAAFGALAAWLGAPAAFIAAGLVGLAGAALIARTVSKP